MRTSRRFLPVWLFVPLLAMASGVSQGAVQSPAACSGADCGRLEQLWPAAARIHEIKNGFVAAVRQFVEAIAGSYGDEGPRVTAALGAMRGQLVQWDDAVRAYEAALAGLPEVAEVHVALGTVYLDRMRTADALREFAAARRLDPNRTDVPALAALAFGLDGKPEEAAKAWADVTAADRDNPIPFYSLAQQLLKLGKSGPALDALRTFYRLQMRRQAPASPSPPAPFERANLLRQAAGVAPIFALDVYRPGFARLLAGDFVEAVAAFAGAAASDPLVVDSPAGDDGRARGAAALRAGELTTALASLEAAVSRTPERSEAHRLLGVAYWADEQYEKSVAQFEAAIRLAPRDERSRMALGDVLAEMGRTDAARHALEEAIRAFPESGQAHYRLGQLFQSLSLLPGAVEELEASALLVPIVGIDRLYEMIGGLYANQARFDEAVRAYARRVDVNPNHGEAHLRLGEIYFLQGRDEEALAEYSAAILLDARNPNAHSASSQVYLRIGRFDEALAAAERALALEPRHKDARFALATALMRLGRTQEGRRELEAFQRQQAEAMANTQRQTELKMIRGDAQQALDRKDFAAAADRLRQALAIDPDSPALGRDLAVALLGAGRFDEAAQVLERLLARDETVDGHGLLADAYRALGRGADSQRETERAAVVAARMKQERLRRIAGR